jgi:hypothetical protein
MRSSVRSQKQFDVFLSHNSQDKAEVRKLKKQLVAKQLSVWLDEDELVPGTKWQTALAKGMQQSQTIAVLVGKDGVGTWEDEEVQAALVRAVKRKTRIIPVLLPNAPKKPRLPAFLEVRTWVDFRSGTRGENITRLVRGITEGFGKTTAAAVKIGSLLRQLQRSQRSGKLRHSQLAPVVFQLLMEESELETIPDANALELLLKAIEVGDEYFVRIHAEAGVDEWQEDFRCAAVPLLVAMAKSFRRSPESQALIVRGINVVAKRFRLRVIWPHTAKLRNRCVNAIYLKCLRAIELENDDALMVLRQLRVIGPE